MSTTIVRRMSTLAGNASPRARAIDRLEIDRDAYYEAYVNGRASYFEWQHAVIRLECETRKPGIH